MSSTQELAQSSAPCRVEGTDEDTVVSTIWFKTKPLDNVFCYRVAQLQLCTDSSDLGKVLDKSAGSWSWFEVAIFLNAEATEPKVEDGKELSWRSHSNTLGVSARSRHFGAVFDRRGELLDSLEAGNVIAVRVCARHPGWVNDAASGYLVAKVLNEDLFSPNSWTLSSSSTPDIPEAMETGVYTLTSTTDCHIQAQGSILASQVWFSSPPLDEYVIAKIEEIRLSTDSHDQGFTSAPQAGSWSWFDIVVLETPAATSPKVKNGRELVWFSHQNKIGEKEYSQQEGLAFGQGHELLSSLQVGNVIAVRVCAQFPGWENHCRDGHLLVRISNKGPRPPSRTPTVDWAAVSAGNLKLQGQLEKFLFASTPGNAPAAISVETQLLSQPLRADETYGAGERPLRLLALDGGGVRGISSLQILQTIMSKVTNDPSAKPCDYFDMMAGTSTGGLIAIMLGRLRMTVQDCTKAYYDLAEKIFTGNGLSKTWNLGKGGARYNEEVLENAIKAIVKDRLGDENAPMRTTEQGCKVFVLACRADDLNNQIATHLRTYDNPQIPETLSDCAIWQAGRATSAAPTYFRRMKIGDWEYVDGGLGFNNPALLLMAEALHMFGRARTIGCMLTIGTGMKPNVDLGDESSGPFSTATATGQLVKALIDMATNAEQTHLITKLLVAQDAYYRLNVGQKIAEKRWLETTDPTFYEKWWGKEPVTSEHHTAENWANIVIALDDYKNMDTFVALTKKYLEGETTTVGQCASRITAK